MSMKEIIYQSRSPELNGTVERGNGTAQYEFYAQYDAHPTFTYTPEETAEIRSFL